MIEKIGRSKRKKMEDCKSGDVKREVSDRSSDTERERDKERVIVRARAREREREKLKKDERRRIFRRCQRIKEGGGRKRERNMKNWNTTALDSTIFHFTLLYSTQLYFILCRHPSSF